MSQEPQEIHPILQQASRYAHSAVQLDNQGSHSDAVAFYEKAVGCLDAALREPTIAKDANSIRQCIKSYQDRVIVLQQSIQQHQQELQKQQQQLNLPQVPSSNSTTTTVIDVPAPGTVSSTGPNQDPSVVDVGITAVKEANKKGGKYIVQGYNAAVDFNEKHQVVSKVQEGAKKMYDATVAFDEKYKVTENIRTGTVAAVEKAKQINEEHKITEKVGTIATATVKKVGELDREYKVTETVGKTIMSGINYLADASASYLQGDNKTTTTTTTVVTK